MGSILSFAHIECIINGHRVQGFSDDARPIEFSDDDLFEKKIGKDGGLYGTDTAMFGGDLTFRLEPGAVSAGWFMQQRELKNQAEINGTARIIYAGTYRDIVQGRMARLEGGVLMKAPAMSEPGQTYEAMITFQRIITLNEGAQFAPYLEVG